MSQFEREEIHFERERVILEAIKNHPNLHHNEIIKKIVPVHMAKTTFERTRDELIEKNILSSFMKGNRKYYQITQNYQTKTLHLIERISHLNFQNLQHDVKHWNENYYHKDVNEKIFYSKIFLKNLFQIDNEFTFLDAIKNSKKTLYKDEHQTIQEMISQIFVNLTNDKDSEIIFLSIINYVDLNLSKSFGE
jgi:hypothetical protein